jgi:ribose-phosphate pyrophosphokinase
MTDITARGEKRLVLAAGRAHPELAREIAKELGTELLPVDAYDFANGEIYVRAGESVRGTDAFVIQAHPAPLNNHLMEQLIMIDSLKRASAKRITVVSPFYPYSRQDKKGRGREPISARLVADLYKTAGADRIMSVDLHTSQIQGFFDGPVDHLMAIPLLADYIPPGSQRTTSRWCPRTPAASAWLSSGPNALAARRWLSSTRAATLPFPTRLSPRQWWARSRVAPVSSSTT